MEDTLKIVIIACIGAVAALLVRQYKPEFAVFAQLGGLMAVLIGAVSIISAVIEYSQELIEIPYLQSGYIDVLFKAVGVAVTAKIGADICRDSGNSALAFAVELAGKAAIILLSMPMLKTLADAAAGLLKG